MKLQLWLDQLLQLCTFLQHLSTGTWLFVIFFTYYKMLAYHYFSIKFQVDRLRNKLLAKCHSHRQQNTTDIWCFYVFVISQPVELKLDSELEDISIIWIKTTTQIFCGVPMHLSGLPQSQAPRSPIQLLIAVPLTANFVKKPTTLMKYQWTID